MGQSKGGGYQKLDTLPPEVKTFLQQLLGPALENQQGAAQGFKQFLPGGNAINPIAAAAQNRFQQQTIPSIMNAFGRDNKGSSALNQALAAGGANLNLDLASQQSQNQLAAAQGLGNLGQGQGQLAAGTQQFAYQPRQNSYLQDLLLAGISGGSQLGSSYLGRGGV
jgi:hypothetical protein